jgi:hypothetical protein
VACEPNTCARGDEPLGRIPLIPPDCVAVVRWELVVEVVVALAERDERGEEMVSRRESVVERRLAKPVCERVDAKGTLGELSQ